MRGLVIRWITTFVAVLAAASILNGQVWYTSLGGVAIFAAVLALLNAFAKPVLTLITAPITCLTLGLFVLAINAFLFWLASEVTGGSAVGVNGVTGALLGSIVVSLVSFLATIVTRGQR